MQRKKKIVTLVLPVNPPTLALITAATRHLYSARASFAVMSRVSRLATKLRRVDLRSFANLDKYQPFVNLVATTTTPLFIGGGVHEPSVR